jgi:AraC-like DNA-binding protein
MHDTLDEIWEQPSCWDDALRRRFPGVDVVQAPPQDPAAAILSAPLTALSADSPADSPLLALLDALWGSAPHLSATQQRHALASLDALLGVTSIAQRGAEQVRRHARFERAAAFIAAALADPDLTPSQVASAQHISRRSLDAIFAQHGWTITRWIWEQRLSAASAALRAPAHAHRSLLDIAIAHGFTSSSHFSRAFRARFGLTPSAWRAAPHTS